MFQHIPLYNSTLLCVNYNNNWQFCLAEFCKIMFDDKKLHYEYLLTTLNDYKKLFKFKRGQVVICKDTEKIKEYITKTSNKVALNDKFCLINVDEQLFSNHFKKFVNLSATVDLRFFCSYLKARQKQLVEMQKETKLHFPEFCDYLYAKCPCWVKLLQNEEVLNVFLELCNNLEGPRQYFETATEDLQNYLRHYKSANEKRKLDEFSDDEEEEDEEEEKETTALLIDVTENNTQLITEHQIHNTKEILLRMIHPKSAPGKKRRLSKTDKNVVAADQDWNCGMCRHKLPSTFHVDHLEDFAISGNDHYTNLWALCPNCHAKKGESDRKRKNPEVWCGYDDLTKAQVAEKVNRFVAKISLV